MSSIFEDESKVLYDTIPSRLLHREGELKRLEVYFSSLLDNPGNMSVKVHIVGPTGAGKTALARRFGILIENKGETQGVKIKSVYVNCIFASSTFSVISFILREFLSMLKGKSWGSLRGQSPGEMLKALNQILQKENMYLLIILDEIGSIVENRKAGSDAVYMLARMRECVSSLDAPLRVSLIYISKDLNWWKQLDSSTLNTVGSTVIELKEYSEQQLVDILTYRAEEAFKPGVLSTDILNFVSDLALAYNGGARYAMELLWNAGKIAEGEFARSVLPEHIRKAHAYSCKANGVYYAITLLPLHKQLLFLGLSSTLSRSFQPYIKFEEAYEGYKVQCETYGIKSEDDSRIRGYLHELSREGLVFLKKEYDQLLVGTELPMTGITNLLEKNLKTWYRGLA